MGVRCHGQTHANFTFAYIFQEDFVAGRDRICSVEVSIRRPPVEERIRAGQHHFVSAAMKSVHV